MITAEIFFVPLTSTTLESVASYKNKTHYRLWIGGVEEHKSEASWIDHFIKYVKTSAGVHQIVTLVDENGREDTHERSQTLWKAIKTLPSRKIDFAEATIENARKLIQTFSFINVQISLFITIQSQLDDQSQKRLIKVHDFLVKLSQNRKRPKCLMIFFREKENQTYDYLLRDLWTKQFLDATVLEIVKPKAERKDFFLDHHPEMVRVSYYNPFTEAITRREASRDFQLFPDKLVNMHGYEMKIAFVDKPPSVCLSQNQSTEKVSGLMFEKVKALSKAMKFSMKILRNITRDLKISCNKKGGSGIGVSLVNNEIHLSGIEFGRFAKCENVLFEWSRGIGTVDLCLVVPILQGETSLLRTWNVLNIVVVLSMPLILWVISRLLRFDKRNWRLEYMMEIIFGFSVPREPDKQAERLFFAASLWAYFIYSSVIYSALTCINVSQNNLTRFQDFDEVVNSELQILVRPLRYTLVYNISVGSVRHLLNRATKVNLTDEECIDRVLKYKNVACVTAEDAAKWRLRDEKDSCGRPAAKIMEEYISKSFSNTVLAPGSPFVNKIGNLIQRLQQTGSVNRWLKDYYDFKESEKTLDTSISCTPYKSELAKIMRHLIILVGFGYVCSIIIFFLELITPFLKKKGQLLSYVN